MWIKENNEISNNREIVEDLESPEKDKQIKAGKLSEEVWIREDTVEKLAKSKLGTLKDTLDISTWKESSEAIILNEKKEQIPQTNHNNLNQDLFNPFKADKTTNVLSQNTDALKYTWKSIWTLAIGLWKWIINTPSDLLSLIKGEKIYKRPNLPDKFA